MLPRFRANPPQTFPSSLPFLLPPASHPPVFRRPPLAFQIEIAPEISKLSNALSSNCVIFRRSEYRVCSLNGESHSSRWQPEIWKPSVLLATFSRYATSSFRVCSRRPPPESEQHFWFASSSFWPFRSENRDQSTPSLVWISTLTYFNEIIHTLGTAHLPFIVSAKKQGWETRIHQIVSHFLSSEWESTQSEEIFIN